MHLIQLHDGIHNATVVINALQNLQSALSRAVLYIARPSVRLSPFVRPSVAWVDQSKTVGEDYAISIVIVLHSLYRAAVSALLSLVVLLIMLCEIACCTCTPVWANKEGKKEGIFTVQ